MGRNGYVGQGAREGANAMKCVVVGGNTGGAGAAARLRRLDERARIVMFEKGAHVSYSNCSLPYRLSDTVDATEKLVLNTPEALWGAYRVDTRTRCEVTAIDRARKVVTVHDLDREQSYEEPYDKLVLAPGANAIVPRIAGIEGARVFTLKTVEDAGRLYDDLHASAARRVTVVGGGFIGIEVVVNLREAGYEVALVEAMPQILRTFDHDMVQLLQKELIDHGVEVHLGDAVEAFEGSDVRLASGRVVPGDAAVMAIGVRPDTKLAADAGLALNERGAIVVDGSYRTSDPDVYAVGDAVEVFGALTHRPMMLQLAGPAQKQARQAADALCGLPVRNTGYIGSSCIKVFDLNAASTGLTAAQCEQEGISFDYAYVLPQDRVGLMPHASPVHLKVVFEVPTGRVLGAQAISRGEAVKRVDVVATAIKFGATVDDLRDLELCYAPPFSTAKDPVNYAGLVASNLVQGTFHQVHVGDVRSLVEAGAFILDVRPQAVYELGHVKGSVNIPMAQLRDRLDEIPRDRPVYVQCQIGQTSYNAVMALQGNGFTNVFNVAGGFRGICAHEYFEDHATGRASIVTRYPF